MLAAVAAALWLWKLELEILHLCDYAAMAPIKLPRRPLLCPRIPLFLIPRLEQMSSLPPGRPSDSPPKQKEAIMASCQDTAGQQAWFLKKSRPVELPVFDALTLPQSQFEEFVAAKLRLRHGPDEQPNKPEHPATAEKDVAMTDDSFTIVSNSTSAEIRGDLDKMALDEEALDDALDKALEKSPTGQTSENPTPASTEKPQHPFMKGLLQFHEPETPETPDMENKMLTENGDVTYRSTSSPLVDLFSELDELTSGPRLVELLQASWATDPLATLKIIFNSRSIHLGQGSKHVFYRCAGWLAKNHPHTLIANLKWLNRPIIEKNMKEPGSDEPVLVDAKDIIEDADQDEVSKYDVKHGVAHGYWKDLLNLLALAVRGHLDPLKRPRDILNIKNPGFSCGIRISRIGPRTGRSRGRGRGSGRGGVVSAASTRGRGRGSGVQPVTATRGHVRGRGAAATPANPRVNRFDVLSGTESSEKDSSDEEDLEQDDAEELQEHESTPDTFEKMPPAESDHKTATEAYNAARDEIRNSEATPKEKKRQIRDLHHKAVINALNNDPVYLALHLTVARIFADQLDADLRALRGTDAQAKRSITLCGKWAPTHDHFHDQHTYIVSSIAEIMYPRDTFDTLDPAESRETYLRHAREKYRQDTSALRKHLEVVERNITAQAFADIKYDRVPSIAMRNYSKLFMEKDMDRFDKYLDKVVEGKANISGATLLPSTLILAASKAGLTSTAGSLSSMIEAKKAQMEQKVIDGQWKTLVQRIKDSGTLSSSMAICDVSGSMSSPRFPDGTEPIHSAIGLSMLIAEVTEPPFGSCFITFSATPSVVPLSLERSLVQKYQDMVRSKWGMNTDFASVFTELILPMAQRHSLKQEDMVKRVFVFSDMHFDEAERVHHWDRSGTEPSPSWSSSFERVKAEYKKAGYEMPELIFWNLAGGRGDGSTAPKPVEATEEGTSLVSGYSQAMLKVFMEQGGFEEPEEEEVVTKNEAGEDVVVVQKKKAKMDPLSTLKKAIGHKAYSMLVVLD
ncbi:hypothetical protein B0I35DRAFT_437090 [Stachybotrys elegans]|uniref:DUF2828 domain-containing protein n=1 Tax=Stachybotrys elegans TaxID=80388 RepID=A0A8K0WQB5_9HYPO|nr:hypothetical protein B0I35DRAFT_437090 [Stachybotrys elegans]